MALPQAIDILNYLHLIFLHVREFHRTLSEVVSSLTADHSFIQSPQERHLEEHSATQPLLSILRIVPHLVYATQTYIRQNHVILNIAQIQHHPTFIGISCSLYISFIQANTQFVSASTMYAMQSNANSCMPSAPLARSGSPPRCCKHLPSIITLLSIMYNNCVWMTSLNRHAHSARGVRIDHLHNDVIKRSLLRNCWQKLCVAGQWLE